MSKDDKHHDNRGFERGFVCCYKSEYVITGQLFRVQVFRNSRTIWEKSSERDCIVPIRRFERNYNIVFPDKNFWDLGEPSTADIYMCRLMAQRLKKKGFVVVFCSVENSIGLFCSALISYIISNGHHPTQYEKKKNIFISFYLSNI